MNKYFKGSKTLKSFALDFVQSKGEASFKEIQKFMFELSNPELIFDSIVNRGFYCSYFSDKRNFNGTFSKAKFSIKSDKDKRILVKIKNGKYKVI